MPGAGAREGVEHDLATVDVAVSGFYDFIGYFELPSGCLQKGLDYSCRLLFLTLLLIASSRLLHGQCPRTWQEFLLGVLRKVLDSFDLWEDVLVARFLEVCRPGWENCSLSSNRNLLRWLVFKSLKIPLGFGVPLAISEIRHLKFAPILRHMPDMSHQCLRTRQLRKAVPLQTWVEDAVIKVHVEVLLVVRESSCHILVQHMGTRRVIHRQRYSWFLPVKGSEVILGWSQMIMVVDHWLEKSLLVGLKKLRWNFRRICESIPWRSGQGALELIDTLEAVLVRCSGVRLAGAWGQAVLHILLIQVTVLMPSLHHNYGIILQQIHLPCHPIVDIEVVELARFDLLLTRGFFLLLWLFQFNCLSAVNGIHTRGGFFVGDFGF